VHSALLRPPKHGRPPRNGPFLAVNVFLMIVTVHFNCQLYCSLTLSPPWKQCSGFRGQELQERAVSKNEDQSRWIIRQPNTCYSKDIPLPVTSHIFQRINLPCSIGQNSDLGPPWMPFKYCHPWFCEALWQSSFLMLWASGTQDCFETEMTLIWFSQVKNKGPAVVKRGPSSKFIGPVWQTVWILTSFFCKL
jgi:hypothetical protein